MKMVFSSTSQSEAGSLSGGENMKIFPIKKNLLNKGVGERRLLASLLASLWFIYIINRNQMDIIMSLCL